MLCLTYLKETDEVVVGSIGKIEPWKVCITELKDEENEDEGKTIRKYLMCIEIVFKLFTLKCFLSLIDLFS